MARPTSARRPKFVKTAGERPVTWREANLRHFQGRWAGQPFYLLPWQKHLIGELFGSRLTASMKRRTTSTSSGDIAAQYRAG